MNSSWTKATFSPLLLLLVVLALSCQGIEAPEGLWEVEESAGPTVVFDLFARPLPEVPLPSDIATRPDPTAATGLRLNASMLAPTQYEQYVRRELDRLDGWGTYAAASVTFEPEEQLLDLGNILERHSGDNYDFTNDAVYIINIDRDSPDYGRPVAIDMGEGNFPWSLPDRDDYWDNDPRGNSSTLIFDTVYEDTNGNGVLDLCEDRNRNGVQDPGEVDRNGDGVLFSAERDDNGNGVLDAEEDLNGNGRFDCSEDTDFDGVLDIPNLFCDLDGDGEADYDPWECPDVVVPTDGDDVVLPASDAWLTLFYERETNTLLLQPILPMDERTTYAVVLTDRLTDMDDNPVNSPFAANHHVDQSNAIEPLADIIRQRPEYYGDLTIENVRFAWTFTTQSITGDFPEIREGLYGRGPLSDLADEFPPELRVDLLHECQAGIECRMPDNRHTIWATETDGEIGLLDVVGELLTRIDVGLGADADMVDLVMAPYPAVDYFVSMRYRSPNFLDNDGVSEDIDGDGRLDLVEEDLNANGILETGEDLDFDGNLDVNEDANANGILDGQEGYFNLDIANGSYPHSSHNVTAWLAVPKPDPERGIGPPYPVVLYNHGYGFLRIESLILAGHLARYGFATIGVDAVGHGLGGIDQMLVDAVVSIFDAENLGPLGDALTTDRAMDLNGDGMRDSGADFVTADIVHMRDQVRQTSIDLARLVQIIRSFDGERHWNQDLNGDGITELAGDFNGDGVVDIGGMDTEFFATGNSLGGINSTVFTGLEPRVVAAAPLSGGGSLASVGLRTTLGNVQAAVVLQMLGPLLITNPASRHYRMLRCGAPEECPGGGGCVDGYCRCTIDRDCSGQTGYRCFDAPMDQSEGGMVCAEQGDDTTCPLDSISARIMINDYNNDVSVEFACLPEDEIREGDTLVARNLVNGEHDCFVAWPGGRSRLHIPSDRGDEILLEVYDGDVIVEGDRCTLAEDAEPRLVITEFEREATFQLDTFEPGDRLIAPSKGFGLPRARPGARRFINIAQLLIDSADPANLARHHARRPVDFGEETMRAATLNVTTVGDDAVAVSTGLNIARSLGILDYQTPDPRLADTANPEGRTLNRYLIDHGVMDGLTRLSYYRRVSDGRQVNFDPDDYDRTASPPFDGWEDDGLGAPSTAIPLRAWAPIVPGEVCTCLDGSGEHECSWPGDTVGIIEMVNCPSGVTALALPYYKIDGSHALVPDFDGTFDVQTYMSNMIGWYFHTRGTELRWDLCMVDNSCTEAENGFYTPPVPVPEPEEE